MHMSTATPDPTGHDRTAASAAAMEQAFQLYKMIASLKTQAQSRSSHLLLFPLSRLGAARQSVLAEQSHLDPSTTSRHVADLVREGLVERRPDPDDGRASLLALTPAGHDSLTRMRDQRVEGAGRGLADWSVEEIAAFGADLGRFTAAMGPLLQEFNRLGTPPTAGAPTPSTTAPGTTAPGTAAPSTATHDPVLQHATSSAASQEDR